MNESISSKQDGQMQELLNLLEVMQTEVEQKDKSIERLQVQLQELLELSERLNKENRAENVQVLKRELKQTRDLWQKDKRQLEEAGIMIKELQDKLTEANHEKEYAKAYQGEVAIPAERPVLYKKCYKCDRTAYQKAKDKYDKDRNRLDKQYKAKMASSSMAFAGFVLYSLLITIFAAIRSGVFISDFKTFFVALWDELREVLQWLLFVGECVAQAGDKVPNIIAAKVIHWLLLVIVVGGVSFVVGAAIRKGAIKLKDLYYNNCWDIVSIMVVTISLAILVYFGEQIKKIIQLNFMVILLLMQVVYVGIRWYVKNGNLHRGYY